MCPLVRVPRSIMLTSLSGAGCRLLASIRHSHWGTFRAHVSGMLLASALIDNGRASSAMSDSHDIGDANTLAVAHPHAGSYLLSTLGAVSVLLDFTSGNGFSADAGLLQGSNVLTALQQCVQWATLMLRTCVDVDGKQEPGKLCAAAVVVHTPGFRVHVGLYCQGYVGDCWAPRCARPSVCCVFSVMDFCCLLPLYICTYMGKQARDATAHTCLTIRARDCCTPLCLPVQASPSVPCQTVSGCALSTRCTLHLSEMLRWPFCTASSASLSSAPPLNQLQSLRPAARATPNRPFPMLRAKRALAVSRRLPMRG
jgi:hypothetical protein